MKNNQKSLLKLIDGEIGVASIADGRLQKKARHQSYVRSRPDKWKMPPEVLKAAKKGKHTVMSDRARLYRTVSPLWACKPTLAKIWEEVEQGGYFKGSYFGLRCLDCQREVPEFTSLLKTTYCPAKQDQWPEVSTGFIHLGKAKGREGLGLQEHGRENREPRSFEDTMGFHTP